MHLLVTKSNLVI